MEWRWSEIRQSGGHWRKRSKRFSGGTKFNIFLVLCFLALVGWGVAVFSRPYLRKTRLERVMGEYMRDYQSLGEEEMIERVIKEAEKLGIQGLTQDNFEFEGGVGKDSTFRCSYNEFIKLPGNKFYKIEIKAEKNLFIPMRY